MSSAGWFRGRSFELIRTRSVFVSVNPTPTTLSQRRAVLHALQRHGTIEVFKRLPDPSSFLCAFEKRQEAVDIAHKSPLTFKLVSEPLESIESNPITDSKPVSVAAPIDLHFVEGEDARVKRDQVDPSITQSDPIKTFTLWAKPSGNRYNHKTNIRRNPIHGPWPEVETTDRDFTYFALKEVIPESLAQLGLCDWTTGGQLSEDAKLARQEENGGERWQIRERFERRRSRERAIAAKDELTSWKSIRDALRLSDDAPTDASASGIGSNDEMGTMAVDQPVDEEYGSEIISESLRMDDLHSQGVDSLQGSLDTQGPHSTGAPESDSQPNGGDLVAKLAGSQPLPKVLEIQRSSKAAPTLDSGTGSLHSESETQGDEQKLPLNQGKDT